MEKIAVFPGSFDPFTKGHEDIVLRALGMFDKIIIAVGSNTSKNYMFSEKERLNIIEQTFINNKQIIVSAYNELTVDFCKKNSSQYILRGLRNSIDFEYEKSIAQINKQMNEGIETILLYTSAQYAGISSTIIRELIKHKGDVSDFLPNNVKI